MYRSFRAVNFRGFKELAIEGFKGINLIAGKNNAGKTSLLEALYLLSGANASLAITVNLIRGMNLSFLGNMPVFQSAPWEPIFYGFDTSRTVELMGEMDNKDSQFSRRLQFSVKPLADVNARNPQVVGTPEGLQPGYVPTIADYGYVLELIQTENGSESQPYYLVMRNLAGTSQLIPIPLPPPPPLPAILITAGPQVSGEDAIRFSRLEILREQQQLLDALHIIEPDLRRLSLVVEYGSPTIYADVGLKQLVPLYLVGEGTSRMAEIILAMSEYRNGAVLIDEIGHGFHYSVLENVWRVIYEAAKAYNVQVFATTHSLECIQAAHHSLGENGDYDFGLFRLDKKPDGRVRAVSYDRETLETAIEINAEVR